MIYPTDTTKEHEFYIRVRVQRDALRVFISTIMRAEQSPPRAISQPPTTDILISSLQIVARQTSIVSNAALIETLSPLIYVFIYQRSIAAYQHISLCCVRFCTYAPIAKYIPTPRPFAVDVMNNYYLLDENVILRAAPSNNFNTNIDAAASPYQYYQDTRVIDIAAHVIAGGPISLIFTTAPSNEYNRITCNGTRPIGIRRPCPAMTIILTRAHYHIIMRQFSTAKHYECMRTEDLCDRDGIFSVAEL